MSRRSKGPQDQFGMAWRPEIAAELLENLEQIDVLEVVAEHLFEASPATLKAFRALRPHVDLVLHGVSMGLASCRSVRPALVQKTAALFKQLEPVYWSEHLAFVRGAGFELKSLAVPPRNAFTVAATVQNIQRASKIIGARPVLENAASVLEPPGSDRDEATWLIEVLAASGCDLLLDLHNVYANSINSGFDAAEFVARLPGDRIAAIHLAGGKWIGQGKGALRLDAHNEDVPEPVFELLEQVGARTSRPLKVILEWDAQYPPVPKLLAQLDRAREALARGRRRLEGLAVPRSKSEALALESFLAQLYADPASRERFFADPQAAPAGVSAALAEQLRGLDLRRLRIMAANVEGSTRREQAARDGLPREGTATPGESMPRH